MRRLIGKGGSMHFEMIVSFVFFVGFVLFLFLILKPHDVSTLSGSVIKGFYDSFEEEVSTNLSSVFLRANYTGAGCFVISLPGRIFSYAIFDGDSHVADLVGASVESGLDGTVDGGDLGIDSTDNYFRVFISPEFDDEGLAGCELLLDYDLGGIVERRVVSYSALVEMRERYYNDYDSLREELRIPVIFDFAIVNENLPEVLMEPSHGVLGSSEVVVRDYLMEVLYPSGMVINERFSLKVW
jgi:hypothetical protein